MFCYYGFEACGDVAEGDAQCQAVRSPRRCGMTIYVGGVRGDPGLPGAGDGGGPDVGAVLKGDDKDPGGHDPWARGHG